VVNNTMDALEWLRKQLDSDGVDLLQRLMSAEVDSLTGAVWGERSAERVNHRNGYRDRPQGRHDRSGDPEAAAGSYFPDCLLDPRRRAEKALVAVVAECYVRGVSTRRVDGLVKTLGIESLSKSRCHAWPPNSRDGRRVPQPPQDGYGRVLVVQSVCRARAGSPTSSLAVAGRPPLPGRIATLRAFPPRPRS